MVKIYDPYDVMAARKIDADARYVLATDYAKLEAENAELRDMEQCSHELFEAACNDLGDAQEQLAAANATLDRLREVVNKWMEFDGFTAYDVMDAIRTILYPTPENENGMD